MDNFFGNLVVLVRSAKNLSQEDFAERVGVDKSLISRYESGRRKLTLEKFTGFCKKLGIPRKMIALLTGEGIKPTNLALAQEIGLVLLKEVTEGLKHKNGNKHIPY